MIAIGPKLGCRFPSFSRPADEDGGSSVRRSPRKASKSLIPCHDPGTLELLGHVAAMSAAQVLHAAGGSGAAGGRHCTAPRVPPAGADGRWHPALPAPHSAAASPGPASARPPHPCLLLPAGRCGRRWRAPRRRGRSGGAAASASAASC